MSSQKLKLADLSNEQQIYFTWAFNALFPFYLGADKFLMTHQQVIQKVASQLLKIIDYTPTAIYRGILLKEPVSQIDPHPNLFFLPFSADRKVAKQFASVNGFGSEIMNLEKRLGKYGYIITYTPKLSEILFHYQLLNYLPFAEAFNTLHLHGQTEIAGLIKQQEISLLQPKAPFTDITPQF